MPSNLTTHSVHRMLFQMQDLTSAWLRGKTSAPEYTGVGSMRMVEPGFARVALLDTKGNEIGFITRKTALVNDVTHDAPGETRIITSADLTGGEVLLGMSVSGSARLNLYKDAQEDSAKLPDYISSIRFFGVHEQMVLAAYALRFNMMLN